MFESEHMGVRFRTGSGHFVRVDFEKTRAYAASAAVAVLAFVARLIITVVGREGLVTENY